MARIQLNLEKSVGKLKLCLKKAGVNTPPEVEVAFDLDVSGSFDDEHRDGLTDAILTRLVPWGLVFDPDKKLDVFTFSDGSAHAHYVGEVTAKNYEGFVPRNIIGKVPGYNGGTDYAHVIRLNLEHFGWIQKSKKNRSVQAQEEPRFRGGFFSKLFGFGKKPKVEAPVEQSVEPSPVAVPQRKSLILFVTDGDNSDRSETERLLNEMLSRGDQVYVMFFGMSNQNVGFEFLKKMERKFDNVGLYICHDIAGFTESSDDKINDLIITDKLVDWLNN